MAIANDPDVIIADEPTTALDVTIQAQVLEVLKKAQESTGAAIVMITHDLGVVAGFADRVMVMYAGRPVEPGSVDDDLLPAAHAVHDRTARLDPAPGRRRARSALVPIEGNPPSLGRAAARLPVRAALPDRGRRRARGGARAGARRAPATLRPATAPGEIELGRDCRRGRSLPGAGARPRRRGRPACRATERRDRARASRSWSSTSRCIEGRRLQAAGRHGPRGRRHQLRHPLRARRSASSASRAAARPPRCWRSWSWPSRSRAAGRRARQGQRQRPGKRERRRTAPRPAGRLPGPDGLARPAHAGRRHPRRAAAHARLGQGPVGPRVDRTAQTGRARARARRPLPAGVLRRPAAAHRHRPRPGAGAEADRARRAGLRARRVHPGGCHQPARGAEGEARASATCSWPTTCPWCGTSPTGSRSCTWAASSRSARSPRSSSAPSHPYTQALLSAVPLPDPRKERDRRADPARRATCLSPADIPSGCRFRTRCPKFRTLSEADQARCIGEDPQLHELASDHRAACHFAAALEVV